jgi:carbon-monoxide dehydrogenase large subunit
MAHQGVGARVLRKEDDRFLHGRGLFVGDVQLPGLWHAAFRRSEHAHARIGAIHRPSGYEGQVFTAADMADIRPIRSPTTLPGFKLSDFPVLASGKVRYVGEQIAIAVAPSRAEAEDIAEAIEVDFDVLPAIVSADAGRARGAAVLHEHWGDNICVETKFEAGDLEAAKRAAAHAVTRTYRMARQTPFPMEGRGVCAHYDGRLDEYVVWISHQLPHPMQNGLCKFLGIETNRLRVICPDVGGGFGLKTHLDGETVAVTWVARRLGRPVKWVQDRYEHLVTDANCREHDYKITMYADARGKILGVEGECTVDAGAYSPWPWPIGIEGATAVGNLQGPYDVRAFRGRSVTVCTNKPASQPYRGVARPGVCFTDELTLDAVARAVGREPWEVRLENLVRPDQMPYDTITRKHLDSGDYPEVLRRAVTMIDPAKVRVRQKTPEPDGRLIGVGFATFYEQTAYGTGPHGYAAWGIELVPGLEMATVKLTADGGLWLSVGIHSHGQGLETTLAQVANQVLGVDPAKVAVRYGDTATAYHGTGTYTSRNMVVAGGAVAKACEELKPALARIGAHLLQCRVDEVRVEEAAVKGPRGSVSFAAIGEAYYNHPENLPDDHDPHGLTVTTGYKDKVHGGVYGFGAHGAVVAIDPGTGKVEILDYAIVHDCGTMVNPLIVDGQIIGGLSGGIGNVLLEESRYDERGQPLSVTLADYHVPAATSMPDLKLDHVVTPSPYTTFGIKGVGEAGAIGPLGAIGNAINDALRPLGAEIDETPITARRVFAAIERARRR